MLIRTFILHHEDLSQVLFYAFVITFLWLAECLICIIHPRKKLPHTLVNARFIFTALPIQLFLTGFVLLIMNWDHRHHWGLISYIPLHQNRYVYYISLFMLLDLGEYIYHVTMHKVGFLWKFHLVHHSDLQLDVSTTVREHPGETCVRTCFLMLWVFLLGPGIGILMIRQVFQTFFNILSHAAFRLPGKLNNVVGLLFITSNLHHVHHHYQLPYTNCNYGDVLSIWDRLFGTHRQLPQQETCFGIDSHPDAETNARFVSILKMPFHKSEI